MYRVVAQGPLGTTGTLQAYTRLEYVIPIGPLVPDGTPEPTTLPIMVSSH
jgi:hypothetical protein